MSETTNFAEQILRGVDQYGYASQAIVHPRFAEATRVHDWRNYVPEIVQELWPDLSEDAKAIAYLMAEERASSEVWE